MGGFTSGVDSAALQQWLVFRNDGLTTAAAYAVRAAEAGKEDRALGEGEVWDMFDKSRPIARRQVFVLKCIKEASPPLPPFNQ